MYDLDTQTVRPVNNVLMDIFMYLKSGISHDRWVHQLAAKYNATPAVIEKTITEAVRLAEKFGYSRSKQA